MQEVVESNNTRKWRSILSQFDKKDVCHFPEYHSAYESRSEGARSFLWVYCDGNSTFAYPILKAPIILRFNEKKYKTEWFDISSVYGFSGPLCNSEDEEFLSKAWEQFDEWSVKNKIVNEFVRYSVYCQNHRFAHVKSKLEINRPISVSALPLHIDEYLPLLPSKTRNLIRKGFKDGLTYKHKNLRDGLELFIQMYNETMSKNNAPSFFNYDLSYYRYFLEMPENEVGLCFVYLKDQPIAASFGLIHGQYGFYHLGASLSQFGVPGTGNIALYGLADLFIQREVRYFNVGGGRTTDSSDPLFHFKRTNGTSESVFYISKRVINEKAYNELLEIWKYEKKLDSNPVQLQFYRA